MRMPPCLEATLSVSEGRWRRRQVRRARTSPTRADLHIVANLPKRPIAVTYVLVQKLIVILRWNLTDMSPRFRVGSGAVGLPDPRLPLSAGRLGTIEEVPSATCDAAMSSVSLRSIFATAVVILTAGGLLRAPATLGGSRPRTSEKEGVALTPSRRSACYTKPCGWHGSNLMRRTAKLMVLSVWATCYAQMPLSLDDALIREAQSVQTSQASGISTSNLGVQRTPGDEDSTLRVGPLRGGTYPEVLASDPGIRQSARPGRSTPLAKRLFFLAILLATLGSVTALLFMIPAAPPGGPAGGAPAGAAAAPAAAAPVMRARNVRVPDPPPWGPEQESRNPFARWLQRLMIWTIQAQDLDPSQQVTAIIGNLTGEAQELALGLSYQELTVGGQVGGAMVDPVSFLLAQLAANLGPLGEEARMQAMHELFTFHRQSGESIDACLIRYRLIRWRAATGGAQAAMSWEGYTFFLLKAIGPSPQQLVQLLTPTGGRYPQTDAEFGALETQLRRIGHIVENSPHNLGSYTRSQRHSNQHFAIDGWTGDAWPTDGDAQAYVVGQGQPDPWAGGNDPWTVGAQQAPQQATAYTPPANAQQQQYLAGAADDDDEFTDSETDSSDAEDLDYAAMGLTTYTPAQTDEHMYWQYRQAKKNWRSHMRKPTRRIRRFFKRRKGKGKGAPSAKGKGKRRFAFLEAATTEEWDSQFYGGKSRSKGKRRTPGKGKGKGKAGSSRTNPIGRDGNVMTCSICGSDSHFRAECPQNTDAHLVTQAPAPTLTGPIGSILLGTTERQVSFHVTETFAGMTRSSMPILPEIPLTAPAQLPDLPPAWTGQVQPPQMQYMQPTRQITPVSLQPGDPVPSTDMELLIAQRMFITQAASSYGHAAPALSAPTPEASLPVPTTAFSSLSAPSFYGPGIVPPANVAPQIDQNVMAFVHMQRTLRGEVAERHAARITANTGPTEASDGQPAWSAAANQSESFLDTPPQTDTAGFSEQHLLGIQAAQRQSYNTHLHDRARLRQQVAHSNALRAIAAYTHDAPVVRDRDNECPICIETYEVGEMIVRLECAHVMHKECLETWETALVRARRESRYRCPLCRGNPVIIERGLFGEMQVDSPPPAPTAASGSEAEAGYASAAESDSQRTEFVSVAWKGETYHIATRLPDGRLSWIIDPGAWKNLCGADLARQMAQAAKDAGLQPFETKRAEPLNVSGVGKGSQSCKWDMTCPIALTDIEGETSIHRVTTPVVEGDGAHLPGLLGLASLERQNAILDTGNRLLILPGSGEFDILSLLPSGATVLPLEKAPSGHLVLPVDAYSKVRKKGGLLEKPLTLLADSESPSDPPGSSGANSSQ